MTTERLSPAAILSQTNLVGTVSEIQDDPDAPDGSWLDAVDDGNDTDLRVSFPTPSASPVAGAEVQNFRWRLRSTGPGDDPIATLFLYESGVLRATGVPTAISSTSGQVVSLSWDAALLLDPTGAGVECRVRGVAQGGFLDPDDTVEVGAVEWNAEVATVGATAGAAGSSGGARGLAQRQAAAHGAAGSSGSVAGVTEIRDGTIGWAGSAGSVQGSVVRSGVMGGDGGSAGFATGEVGFVTLTRGGAGASGYVTGVAAHAGAATGSAGSTGLARTMPHEHSGACQVNNESPPLEVCEVTGSL